MDVEKFHTERKYGNMSLILNGTDGGGNRYGYKYGYHYGYAGYTKEEVNRMWFFKKQTQSCGKRYFGGIY